MIQRRVLRPSVIQSLVRPTLRATNTLPLSLQLSQQRSFLFGKRKPHPDDNDPILKHIPRFIRPMASRFKNAPLSYVTSFLLVHEITAIIPLFGLWWYFNKYDFVPPGLPDWLIVKGMSVIDKLLETQGWSFLNMENGARVVMQGAAAYALVKATLPVRIPISLVLTPPFARWIFIPVTRSVGRMFKGLFKRNKKVDVKSGEKVAAIKPEAIDKASVPPSTPANPSVFSEKSANIPKTPTPAAPSGTSSTPPNPPKSP